MRGFLTDSILILATAPKTEVCGKSRMTVTV